MCDNIRPFQVASETTENGYKWSQKSEENVFILTIVDLKQKENASRRFGEYHNTAIQD